MDVNLELLTEPFPTTAHKQRQVGGGKSLTYVEGHTVIHRLNAATGNHWNFSVDKIEERAVDANNTLMMAYVTLTLPDLGSRSHVGVQLVNARGGEDLVKGAVTDALKKAATLFGVGLELYGPDYGSGEIDTAPTGTRQNASQTHDVGPGATNAPPVGNRPQARAGTPISEKQIGMIFGQAKRIGWGEGAIHRFAAVDSLHDLDRAQASTLIDDLMKMVPGTPEPVGEAPPPTEHVPNNDDAWTSFWVNARGMGISTKQQFQQATGVELPLNVADARAALALVKRQA